MKGFLLIAMTIPLLSGCAYQSTGVYERPDGKAFNLPNQFRIASASHWQRVAENEAKLLKQRVAGKALIVERNHSSNFSAIYYNLLTGGLVKNGATVFTEDRPGTVKITYDVYIVNHSGGKMTPGLADRDHWPVLSAAAYYILSEAVSIAKVPPAVFAEQTVKNLSSATEIIITTRAIHQARLLYSNSNVYYIDGINQGEYRQTPPAPPPPQINPSEWMWSYRPTK
ncbi:MAG: hypothetical protein QX203_07675 [Methylococcaceae bacterium]